MTAPAPSELEALCAAGQAAWPEVALRREAFAALVARHGAPAPELAGDLYLACACIQGDRRALLAFDAILARSVAGAVRRIDTSPAFADVVTQELRTRLLTGEAPKLGDYAGRAPLARWLKTAAVRTALSMRRNKDDQGHDSVPSGLRAAGEPELEMLRERYRGDFEEALRSALTSLPAKERAILCMSVRDRMSIDKLAAVYRVGRSTAARWLAAARELLVSETRRALQTRLGLTPSELESLAAIVRSDLDVSIGRLLGDE